MATRRTQGMSPATSLMGAARQFGKVGARGSGNKSVQPGGKNKPLPGLSPGTAPRIQGAVKMPEPMRPGAAVYPGGLPKFPTGGAQVKPTVGTQPMAGPMAKGNPSPSGRSQLTNRQSRIIKQGAKALKREGKPRGVVQRTKAALRRGDTLGVGSRGTGKAIKRTSRAVRELKGAKASKRWKRRYKRNVSLQG